MLKEIVVGCGLIILCYMLIVLCGWMFKQMLNEYLKKSGWSRINNK